MSKPLALTLVLSVFLSTLGQASMTTSNPLPAGYWPAEKSQAILDKTRTVKLAPDLSHLSKGEQTAVAKLLEVGRIFQDLYEHQRHAQASESRQELARLSTECLTSLAQGVTAEKILAQVSNRFM